VASGLDDLLAVHGGGFGRILALARRWTISICYTMGLYHGLVSGWGGAFWAKVVE